MASLETFSTRLSGKINNYEKRNLNFPLPNHPSPSLSPLTNPSPITPQSRAVSASSVSTEPKSPLPFLENKEVKVVPSYPSDKFAALNTINNKINSIRARIDLMSNTVGFEDIPEIKKNLTDIFSAIKNVGQDSVDQPLLRRSEGEFAQMNADYGKPGNKYFKEKEYLESAEQLLFDLQDLSSKLEVSISNAYSKNISFKDLFKE